MRADIYFLKGIKTNDIAYFDMAADLFPFKKEILVAKAEFEIRDGLINETTLKDIELALKYDPYSINMLSMLTQYNRILNNNKKSSEYFKKLNVVASNSNLVKELIKLGYK